MILLFFSSYWWHQTHFWFGWLEADDYQPALVSQIAGDFNGEVIFNDEVKTMVFSDQIIQAIDEAQTDIKVAMFALTSPDLVAALLRARERGVIVSLVLDKSNRQRHYGPLAEFYQAGQVVEVGQDEGVDAGRLFMHHKFVLIDAAGSQPVLLTGTVNWTTLQECYDPSFLLVVRQPEVVDVYRQEFDRLWRGIANLDKLHQSGYQPWTAEFQFDNSNLELWWGPGFKTNSWQQRIIDLINSAQTNIRVAIWQLTDRSIARALLARAASGVSVQIISDDYNLWAKDSEFSYLFKERARLGLDNLEIISDGWRSLDLDNIYQAADGGFFNSYFHRHDLLIDDRMLTMGTANWTYRGFWQNDENALVTDDQEIIQAWLNSWNYHYQALRSKKLLLTGTATGFTLDSQQAAGWQNENLLAICEVSGAVRPPEILLQTVLTDSSTTFSIAAPCPQPINLFIYNNQNDLLASGWLE